MYFAIFAAILVVIALILDFLFDGSKTQPKDETPPPWIMDDLSDDY
jgi:hypothetical protein